MMPDAHYAPVYAKPQGKPLVDTFIYEVSQDTWIHFPWDTALSFQPPIRRERGNTVIPGHRERTDAQSSIRAGFVASLLAMTEAVGRPHAPSKPRHPTARHHRHPHRGLFTGNRGIIHDPAHQDAAEKRWSSRLDHLRLRIPGLAAQGDGRRELDRAVLSRRGDRARGRAPALLLLPPRRRQPFRAAWERAMACRVLAREIDAVLHRERLDRGKKRLHPLPMPIANCPMARWCRRARRVS
jgi:hypothetical protein